MGRFADILGTLGTSFGIGPKASRAVLDASALTAPRTHALPDKSGTLALTSDVTAQVNADWNATTGAAKILNKPTLGTAATQDSTAFATAAQGAKADSALQDAAAFATAAQGAKADSAVQPAALTSLAPLASPTFTGTVTLNGSYFVNAAQFRVQPQYQSAQNNGTWFRVPRIFVQPTDPGADAYEGDLWFW
jgi:hypothetical protein